nr:hypothetical protein Iba_chr04aCG24610 [Ipomoea batatas]
MLNTLTSPLTLRGSDSMTETQRSGALVSAQAVWITRLLSPAAAENKTVVYRRNERRAKTEGFILVVFLEVVIHASSPPSPSPTRFRYASGHLSFRPSISETAFSRRIVLNTLTSPSTLRGSDSTTETQRSGAWVSEQAVWITWMRSSAAAAENKTVVNRRKERRAKTEGFILVVFFGVVVHNIFSNIKKGDDERIITVTVTATCNIVNGILYAIFNRRHKLFALQFPYGISGVPNKLPVRLRASFFQTVGLRQRLIEDDYAKNSHVAAAAAGIGFYDGNAQIDRFGLRASDLNHLATVLGNCGGQGDLLEKQNDG